MESLLPEIIVEILISLPVKALCRFKCVSKQWLSLISDPNFVDRHLKQATTHRVLLSSRHRLRLQSLDYEVLINYGDENSAVKNLQAPSQMGSISNHPAKILGSCYGLVSLGLVEKKKILIWNPSTGVCRIIQDTNLTGSYGFGYDYLNDGFKLIKVFAQKGFKDYHFEIFSLRTNSWRSETLRHGDLNFNIVDKVGTFANGSIFWLVENCDAKLVTFMISFDVTKEKFSYLPLPDCGCVQGWNLGVLAGSLSACHCVCGKDGEVWMKKGTEAEMASWVKLGSVPQAEEAEYIRDDLVPLCFAKNSEAVVIKGGLKLYVCDLKKNTCRRILVYDDQNEFEGTLYAESLISPNDYYGAQIQRPTMGRLKTIEKKLRSN